MRRSNPIQAALVASMMCFSGALVPAAVSRKPGEEDEEGYPIDFVASSTLYMPPPPIEEVVAVLTRETEEDPICFPEPSKEPAHAVTKRIKETTFRQKVPMRPECRAGKGVRPAKRRKW